MTEPVLASDGPDTDDPVLVSTERLHASLVQFSACVGNAVPDICTYSLTIGNTYVPFLPDSDDPCQHEPEDAGLHCSQVWIRVMNVTPTAVGSLGFDGFRYQPEMVLNLEVGVIRDVEIPEDGEAPTASDVLGQALQSMSDMNDILCAAVSCGQDPDDASDDERGPWGDIVVGQWTPQGPLGGQYGGTWTFTVTLD